MINIDFILLIAIAILISIHFAIILNQRHNSVLLLIFLSFYVLLHIALLNLIDLSTNFDVMLIVFSLILNSVIDVMLLVENRKKE